MITAMVLTISDRASAGIYQDESGPLLSAGLSEQGYKVIQSVLVPDDVDKISSAISSALALEVRLIVTTGGTGISERDVTPEATVQFIEKMLPGFSEALRALGRKVNAKSDLTRGLAGINGKSLIINLPGSLGGVRDGLVIIGALAGHIFDQLDGGEHVK